VLQVRNQHVAHEPAIICDHLGERVVDRSLAANLLCSRAEAASNLDKKSDLALSLEAVRAGAVN
jgi:hypothetical protein